MINISFAIICVYVVTAWCPVFGSYINIMHLWYNINIRDLMNIHLVLFDFRNSLTQFLKVKLLISSHNSKSWRWNTVLIWSNNTHYWKMNVQLLHIMQANNRTCNLILKIYKEMRMHQDIKTIKPEFFF